eukprot:TRINITY_DN37556_c0_g1_i1.p1 TRINITY_DN37556_c0_g1~~TRINITY_DN37556_c0_g1_i1.p1  ORF type:complete len:1416 (-),score=178.09 TRINITY_DN37556_c0_g1_i1:131-3763(-)
MLGAHSVAVSRTGRLYSWGYGPATGTGSTENIRTPTLVTKFLGFGAGDPGSSRAIAARGEMEPLAWGRHSHARYRHRVSNKHLGLQVLRPRIVKAACGGGFCAVLSSEGEVFTFGLSAGGRLGFRTKFRAQLRPRRIETLKEGTLDVVAGAGFVLLCSASGRLLAWGDNAKGQLGVGHLQESHEPLPLGRVGSSAFVFEAVAAGDSHSLALDSCGQLYSWGGEGGPMTGQGQPTPDAMQVDAAFQFRLQSLPHWWVRPCQVKALLGMRVVHISAGCLHSIALTREGVLFCWGARLQVGVGGGSGGGFTASSRGTLPPQNLAEAAWVPRLMAPSPKLPLLRVTSASAGGWHSLLTAVPSCAIERLEPSDIGDGAHYDEFLDGSLVSRVDSVAPIEGGEASVGLCCAAVRARLALSDGQDSPVWKALSMQVVRRRPAFIDAVAPPLEVGPSAGVGNGLDGAARGMEERRGAAIGSCSIEEDSEDENSLMDIVAMQREQQPASTMRQRRRVAASAKASPPSVADEAAGKALHDTVAKKPALVVPSRSVAKKRVIPEFSSDSSETEQSAPGASLQLQAVAPSPRPRPLLRRGRTAGPPQHRMSPIFSSDSSGSDHETRASRVPHAPAHATTVASARASSSSVNSYSQHQTASAGRSFSVVRGLDIELSDFGECVLTAFVRFLHTDSLANVEVIEETHPLFQREQQLAMRPPSYDEPRERPTQLRASKGPLLRREVDDLRRIGRALQLERLIRLCDQLLLRVDAPGAPTLFVPPSTIDTAMWTLSTQALAGPTSSPDGPDTRVLCGPLGQRRRRWGHRGVPSNGELWAHAFVICTTCSGIVFPENAVTSGGGGGASSGTAGPPIHAQNEQSGCQLRRCWLQARGVVSSKAVLELDLRDTAAEVVFAWLRFLYTQEDLSLLWPCSGNGSEESAAAEHFWTELLRLAQRVGDWRLVLYAQDTLVGSISDENWAQMATFAAQVQCRVLSEAALMTGLRRLLPAMLRSFRVPTGLEPPSEQNLLNEDSDTSHGLESAGVTATVPSAAAAGSESGRPRATFYGKVDIEIDRRLMALRSRDQQSVVLMELKRNSPSQYGELKYRLAESVKSSQQVAEQLQRSVRFFDQSSRENTKNEGRSWWLELAFIGLFFVVAIVPWLRGGFLWFGSAVIAVVRRPFQELGPVISEWMFPDTFGFMHVVCLNMLTVSLLCAVVWHGMKN